MIYIGVTGKSGAGKTSFTDFWDEKSNVGVIHFDDITKNVKIKYFSLLMKEDHKNEKTRINSGLKRKIYSNKLFFKIWMFVRNKMAEKEIERKINDFKRQGKDIIIIDDWMLNYNKKLYSKCNKIFVVKRNFIDRRKGIMTRDQLSLQEVKVADIPFALKFTMLPEGDNVEVINNKGSLDDLKRQMEEKYQEIGVMGFNEKYQIRDEGIKNKLRQVSRKVTTVDKMLRRVSDYSRNENDN